jgi:ferric-dicitrate binding protein FerR (iron transport regulator)
MVIVLGVHRAESLRSGAPMSQSALRSVCEEAAYGYVRCTDEMLNSSHRSEFLRWLSSSPENVAELLRIGIWRARLRQPYLAS